MVRRRPSPEVLTAFFAMLLTGCGGQSKVLYEAPDSHAISKEEISADQDSIISGFRRLALLPVTLEISPKNTDLCMDTCEPERDRSEIALRGNRYLENKLGYEIICLDFACRREPDNPFSDEQLAEWAAELSSWIAEHKEEILLPPAMLDMARQISEAFGVEGIILIHGDIRYVGYTDTLHWIATLTASAYYNLFRGNEAHLRIEVFDTQEGTKLWSAKTTVMQVGTWTMPQGNGSTSYGPALFGEMDPSRESE